MNDNRKHKVCVSYGNVVTVINSTQSEWDESPTMRGRRTTGCLAGFRRIFLYAGGTILPPMPPFHPAMGISEKSNLPGTLGDKSIPSREQNLVVDKGRVRHASIITSSSVQRVTDHCTHD